jgi:hypothetical protein
MNTTYKKHRNLPLFLPLILFACLSGYKLPPDPEGVIKDSHNVLKFENILYTGWYYIVDSGSAYKRTLEKTKEEYFIDPKPITTAGEINSISIYARKEGAYGLIMKLDDKGTAAWSLATNRWIGKKLGFIMDNRLLEVDIVNAQITGGTTALNRGRMSKAELEHLKAILETEK